MKRSRTACVHVSVPKLRIKSKKTSSEEGQPSISDNILEHRKINNDNQSSEDLITSYV